MGETIRDLRIHQGRTLREVSQEAQVSLGYLSEIERGQKEASSEVLSSIAEAFSLTLGELISQVATTALAHESEAVIFLPRLAA